MIPLPEKLGRDFLAQVTGCTPRIMLRLKRYLDQIVSRNVTVEDVYIWVLDYSEEVFAELRKFVITKLPLPEDKSDFKTFLQWYMEPSSVEKRVPQGPSVFSSSYFRG